MVIYSITQPLRRSFQRAKSNWQSRSYDRQRKRQHRREAPLRAAEKRAWQQEQDRLAAERGAREQAVRDTDQQRRNAALTQITGSLKID